MIDVSGKAARWHLGLSEFDFEVGHHANIKCKEAGGILPFLTTRLVESPLLDTIPVLMKAGAQPDGENY